MSAWGTVKRFVARLGRALRDPAYRGMLRLRLRPPPNLFQPYGSTRPGRYPRIFRAAREAVGDGADVQILSFGCATGEEVATLRRHFPLARITGIDINAGSLAVARAALKDDSGVAFAHADSTAAEPDESFDAIFCMAVLRHGDLGSAARADPLLTFDAFARMVADFARCLKPGGVLGLRNSNFRFEDTPSMAGFEVLLDAARTRDTPKFGPDNRRLPDTARELALFRKRAR